MESAKIIVNTFDITETTPDSNADRPVYESESKDDWYYPYLKKAESSNIFYIPEGTTSYNIDLSKPITRGTAFENLNRTIIIKQEKLKAYPYVKIDFADYDKAADFAAENEIKIPVFYKGQINEVSDLSIKQYQVKSPKYLAVDPNEVDVKNDKTLLIEENIEIESNDTGSNYYRRQYSGYLVY